MAGFENEVMFADNIDFSGGSPVTGQITSDGQMLIGSSTPPYLRVSTLTSSDGSLAFTPGAGTLDVTMANNLQVPSDLLISSGRISGYEFGYKYGSSTIVSTSYVDIWPNASILSYLSSAEQMNIASTSLNDDLGSTGLEKVRIFGLDANYQEINEEVVLNGTSNVLTNQAYLRVYRMRGTQAGSGGFNVGTVTATSASSATVQSYIAIGTNNSLQAQFTVPANKWLFVTNVSVTVRSGDQANIRFFVREFGKIFTLRQEYDIVSSSNEFLFSPPIPVPPKADITARAIKIAGGGTVGITCSYEYYLVDASLVNLQG